MVPQDLEGGINVTGRSPPSRLTPKPSEHTLGSNGKHRCSCGTSSKEVDKVATMMDEFLTFGKNK
jgi:hypothetical protein